MNLKNADRPPAPQSALPDREFRVLLSSTRRGARLARLLAVEQLRMWDVPFESAAHIVAELASNAALHGRVAGRDFRLALMLRGGGGAAGTLRIEVTDARSEQLPAAVRSALAEDESGRGLILVDALADAWGVVPGPPPCKTVWAELALAPGSRSPETLAPVGCAPGLRAVKDQRTQGNNQPNPTPPGSGHPQG
ncbi:ATP-binding protein [Streptomyces sp. NPDC050509]|uniref:ATP-binding protein n=1 Tax=Streptomyces sp. NPDC050509 TaxID=3365620 RepID=UPI0037BD2AA7